MQEPTKKEELKLEDTIKELGSLPKQPLRLGIQGAGGEGKTWAALTFPDPVVLNLDNKLGGIQAYNPNSKLKVVNFDYELVSRLKVSNMGFGKPNNPKYQPNAMDAVPLWLTLYGQQLSPEQTLFLDSWTSLQMKFDYQAQLPHEISYTKSGEVDGFKFWGRKLAYSEMMMDLLKSLKCNVVITFHETQDYDEENRPTGKLKPLQQGSFAPKIPTQMTDFYRQRCITRDFKDYEKIKAALRRDITGDREWLWQTQTNALFTACCSIPNMPMLVPANYSSLTKTYDKSK